MEIAPFQGWRYSVAGGDVSRVIAPPYDILSAADKGRLLAADARNIVAVDLPHCPPKEVGPESEYLAAARTLGSWQKSGVLVRDQRPSLYAYEQGYAWGGRTFRRRGLIAAVRLEEFGRSIWPHERTFPGPKADRLRLTQAAQVQLSPIFGFYPDEGQVAAPVSSATGERKPDAHGTLNGVCESLWAISDAAVIAHIQQAMAGRNLFIADGHHRYTTALNYRDSLGVLPPDHPANFVMFVMAAMGDPGLIILPTHRVLSGLKGFDLAKFAAAAADVLDLTPMDPRDAAAGAYEKLGPHAMAFVGMRDGKPAGLAGRVRDLSIMDQVCGEQLPALRELDVTILHRLVIERCLAKFGADAAGMDYTPDAAAAVAAVASGKADLAALLQGTPLSAVTEIALAGAVMPHKSTYFYPKLATGMVLYPLAR